ncbi:MAG TPA: PQQ-binding-like beta-propeller repeat protein [Candidatus Hydrogenedentes bacterium]|nr:PQQ-binding-like beta-propeller repeat protein [Candidatus Hydrogenedentota bacterium]HPG65251.1 PQQ-binding-like beta-propeller repeat protein [Candidatus Hydrogenedentota bacterium]
MSIRGASLIVLMGVVTLGAWGAPTYEVVWTVDGDGGFSAPNLMLEGTTGKPTAIVASVGNVGVCCLELDGRVRWQYAMATPLTAAPAVADLDGDGTDEVIAADSKGHVVALHPDGQPLWRARVPAEVIADSCTAASDLDEDGLLEVLVGDVSGTLSCFSSDGAIRWQFQGDGTQMGPALVADIYDTRGQEVIVTSHDSHVYALTSEGEWLWDLCFPDDLFPNSTPLLADTDGDGVPELYIGGGLNHFYRIDLAEHRVAFEKNVYLHVNNCIAASDIDGDDRDEVVFGTKNVRLWCYDNGDIAWTRDFKSAAFYAAPTLLHLDEDAALEMIVPSLQGDLFFLDTDGSTIAETRTGLKVFAAPLAGDFDGDGMLDLILTESGLNAARGLMVYAKAGVPYREDPRDRTMFAGDRANTCRPPYPESFATIATPKKLVGSSAAEAKLRGEFAVLSGANTYRFDVANPDRERLVLLTEIAAPDGSVRRHARHVSTAGARVRVDVEAGSPGAYTFARRLVNADTLAASGPSAERAVYEGFSSDARYLDAHVFQGLDESLSLWETTNPEAVRAMESTRDALRGRLLQAGQAGATPAALAELRGSAERLGALAQAGVTLAPDQCFIAWPFTPWAYFDSMETLPSAKDRIEVLPALLCAGEYQSLVVNLTSVSGSALDLRVSCGPFDGHEDVSVAQHVELRRAVSVPTVRRERVADALPKLDEAGLLRIAPLASEQLWITVNAVDLEPGTYTTSIRIKSLEPDPSEVEIPLAIHVHDLALPRPRPFRFCLWAYDGGDLGTDRPDVLEDLVEHGVTVFFGQPPEATCDENGTLVWPLDFGRHDESVARLAPHGFLLFASPQGRLTGQPFLSEPWRKAFVQYLRAWAGHMKELGIANDSWALYPYDEPSTPYAETTLNLVEVAKLVREADPNILIYTDPTSGTTMETVRMFTGLIDIWCPSSELLERLGPELVPAAHKAGKEVWFYDAAGRSKTLSCLGLYRWRFWHAWTQGFTGAGWWCYAQHGGLDRWDGPNASGDFFATVYDGVDGVVSSKRWEIAREGVQDYEYLYMLREAIRDAERRGVPAARLASAKELLNTLPAEMEATLLSVGRRIPLSTDSVPLYEEATKAVADARAKVVEVCLHVKELE